MATIITKNSSTASAVPAAGSLVKGELAVNVTDRKIYTKDNSGNVVLVASGTASEDAAASATLANDWATKTSGPVAGGEYSAKYHAQAASTSASSASSSATAANTAKTQAEAARDTTLAAFDSFDDRYLGTKSADPTLDNDGNPLVAGSLYFNSVSGIMKVYTGTAWVAAYVSGEGFVTLTGAETLTNKTLINPVVTRSIQFINSPTTAVRSGEYVFTASTTLTLPASPTSGDIVYFSNRSGTTTCVIARNGQNIMGLAEDMTVDNNNYFGTLVYADAARGWVFE